MKTFPCLYTKQKEKKRKSWSDGIIKLSTTGLCHLYDNCESNMSKKCLETKYVLPAECSKIEAGNELNIDFENYLVQIEARIIKSKDLSKMANLTKSFKIPQQIINPEPNKVVNVAVKPRVSNNLYEVNDTILSDIWDKDDDDDPTLTTTKSFNRHQTVNETQKDNVGAINSWNRDNSVNEKRYDNQPSIQTSYGHGINYNSTNAGTYKSQVNSSRNDALNYEVGDKKNTVDFTSSLYCNSSSSNTQIYENNVQDDIFSNHSNNIHDNKRIKYDETKENISLSYNGTSGSSIIIDPTHNRSIQESNIDDIWGETYIHVDSTQSHLYSTVRSNLVSTDLHLDTRNDLTATPNNIDTNKNVNDVWDFI